MIDLITNLDMSAFHSLGGWDKMLARLAMEVDRCRKEAPTILTAMVKKEEGGGGREGGGEGEGGGGGGEEEGRADGEDAARRESFEEEMEVQQTSSSCGTSSAAAVVFEGSTSMDQGGGGRGQCMPERAALIKSVLNFLKKAIPDPTFAENIRTCELCTVRVLESLFIL